jgi:hypothetical protein
MNKIGFTIVFATVALSVTDTARAFCAAPPPKLCSAYFQADVVLRGKVLSEQRDEEYTRYRIKVEKTFKGRPSPLRSVYTGNDSGGFYLDMGKEYVLFAERRENRLIIGCNEQSLSEANTAVTSEEIGRLQASKSASATIEGQFVAASDFSLPMPGVSVTATGADGIHQVVSDSEGLFLIQVPPGRYRVEVDPAVAEQTIYNLGYTNPKSISLAPGQCAQLQYQGVRL